MLIQALPCIASNIEVWDDCSIQGGVNYLYNCWVSSISKNGKRGAVSSCNLAVVQSSCTALYLQDNNGRSLLHSGLGHPHEQAIIVPLQYPTNYIISAYIHNVPIVADYTSPEVGMSPPNPINLFSSLPTPLTLGIQFKITLQLV